MDTTRRSARFPVLHITGAGVRVLRESGTVKASE